MRRALLGLLLLAAGVLLVLVPLSRGAEEQTAVDRSFTLSADPTVEVLRLTSGAHFERHIFSLFGDGRFGAEIRQVTGELVQEGETHYPFAEVERLVRIAVDHGLADAKKDDLEPIFRELQTIKDLGSMSIELRLESYTRGGEDLGAVDQRLRIPPPRYTNHHFPGNDLIAGLAEIEGFFVTEGRRLLGENGGGR